MHPRHHRKLDRALVTTIRDTRGQWCESYGGNRPDGGFTPLGPIVDANDAA